jgi:hypothetical protein
MSGWETTGSGSQAAANSSGWRLVSLMVKRAWWRRSSSLLAAGHWLYMFASTYLTSWASGGPGSVEIWVQGLCPIVKTPWLRGLKIPSEADPAAPGKFRNSVGNACAPRDRAPLARQSSAIYTLGSGACYPALCGDLAFGVVRSRPESKQKAIGKDPSASLSGR